MSGRRGDFLFTGGGGGSSAGLFLFKVSFTVNFHIVATIELTAALGAGVRLLAVHVTMRGQVTGLSKSRATFLANVLAQTLVLEQMLVEEGFGSVTIVADVANKRLRIRVLQHMRLILGGDLEGLAARVARVRGGVAGLDVLVQHGETGVEIVAKAAAKVTTFLEVYAGNVAE